jgi:hypothetical protein
MPLIRPRAHRVTVVRHIARLQEPNRDALVSYGRFIGESPDYVLNQLIELTLARDRDFVAWRAENAPPAEPGPAPESSPRMSSPGATETIR